MKGKPPRLSQVEMIQQVLPGDTNAHGTVFGGKVLQWLDIAGAVAAMRHVGGPVVTASFDRVDFLAPGRLGEVMVLKGKVNHAGRTSVEVGVEVHAENPTTGERVLTTSALIVYVAIDKKGRPVPVPPLLPESAVEKNRFREAEGRRKARR
jgi:acyl-CoA hydrolase